MPETGPVPAVYVSPEPLAEKRKLQKILVKYPQKVPRWQTVKDFDKYLVFAMDVIGRGKNAGNEQFSGFNSTAQAEQEVVRVKSDQRTIFEAFLNSSITDQAKCVEKYFCVAAADFKAGNRTLSLDVLQMIGEKQTSTNKSGNSPNNHLIN